MANSNRPCHCGSGLHKQANYDARGIFLTFTCDKCHKRKMQEFRPDVLSDPNYWSDEPIESGDLYGAPERNGD